MAPAAVGEQITCERSAPFTSVSLFLQLINLEEDSRDEGLRSQQRKGPQCSCRDYFNS